jgi:DNA-directed RNA polymerase specialized sigma24 family protein
MMYESALLESLKQKDTKAFAVLYDLYSPSLYNCILKLSADATLACTVLEKSFFTIWNTIHQYEPFRQTLFNWMVQTAISQCRECLKMEKTDIVSRMKERQTSVRKHEAAAENPKHDFHFLL